MKVKFYINRFLFLYILPALKIVYSNSVQPAAVTISVAPVASILTDMVPSGDNFIDESADNDSKLAATTLVASVIYIYLRSFINHFLSSRIKNISVLNN